MEKKTEMVCIGQIHPETVQSKTCKGPFLANFARPPRETFLSKELVRKKTCKGPFLANSAGKLGKPFCQRIFAQSFFGRVFLHYLFVKGCNLFVKGCLAVFFSKTSLPISVRLMVFQKFLHSSRQIWIGNILCSSVLWGANPIANYPISSAFSDYLI